MIISQNIFAFILKIYYIFIVDFGIIIKWSLYENKINKAVVIIIFFYMAIVVKKTAEWLFFYNYK